MGGGIPGGGGGGGSAVKATTYLPWLMKAIAPGASERSSHRNASATLGHKSEA